MTLYTVCQRREKMGDYGPPLEIFATKEEAEDFIGMQRDNDVEGYAFFGMEVSPELWDYLCDTFG